MSADLPPIYTQEPSGADVQLSDSDHSFVSAPDGMDTFDVGAASTGAGPQILIIPAADGGVRFQKGYLGADNERAAIEGELHIKSAEAEFRWRKVSVSLRSVEKAHEREIELANTELVLGCEPIPSPQQRSSFPFSIPLPPDAPQCLHTSRSSLAYTLTANVWPAEEDLPPLCRSFLVHTRRYTSHTHELHPVPEKRVIVVPSKVEVQLPRTTFRAREPIPIYITVPTPDAGFVVEQGLRLRNLRAELVRIVYVKRNEMEQDDLSDSEFQEFVPESTQGEHLSSPSNKTDPVPSTSHQAPDFIVRRGIHGERKVVALSGASCRMHPSRPLRIRLVLHQPVEVPQPESPHDQPSSEGFFSTGPDAECASITQSTLLHSVSFRLLVHATFMQMSTHTERVSTLTIPIVILPPSAPLPEVEASVDAAYLKKHDRPPTRTVRLDDMEVPGYEAGPSGAPGAPPPFEEREAPPPFWSAEAEASSSSRLPTFLESEASTSRLPTFLESESEIYVPPTEDTEDTSIVPPSTELVFDGEGTLFGFHSSEQFDGYADVLPQRSFTPPPSLEMATRDANVTGLANMDLDEPAAIEALGLALEQNNIAFNAHALNGEGSTVPVGVSVDDHLLPPPPPPPMDDPSDPPPSIDSAEFRAPGAPHDSPPRTQSPPGHGAIAPHDAGESHGHAPPPYRVPDIGHDNEHERVTHPPPYMDLVHEAH